MFDIMNSTLSKIMACILMYLVPEDLTTLGTSLYAVSCAPPRATTFEQEDMNEELSPKAKKKDEKTPARKTEEKKQRRSTQSF